MLQRILNQFRSEFILIFALGTGFMVAMSGVESGTTEILPGSSLRARDSIAIAQSYSREHRWLGLAAYMDILQELDSKGITIDANLALNNFGTSDYQALLRNRAVTAAAIDAGGKVEIRNPDNLWFVDGDDAGLAFYYIASFEIFGQLVSSLFKFYLLILAISVFTFFVSFWRFPSILILAPIFLLAINALTHIAVEVTTDVNSVVSSRFLPALGILSAIHLVALMSEKGRADIFNVCAAGVQVVILCALVAVRVTSLWLILAVIFTGLVLLFAERRGLKGFLSTALTSKIKGVTLWPAILLIVAFAVSASAFSALKHPVYKNSQLVSQHVFWHSVTTVLHNNPNRTDVFGIAKTPELNPLGDGLGYHLFEEYIRKNKLDRPSYMSNNGERDRLAGIPFLWGAYDSILKRVFFEHVLFAPGYAFASFFYYQPMNIVGAIWNAYKTHSKHIFNVTNAFILISLSLLATPRFRQKATTSSLLIILGFSILPAMTVAPQELRIMDCLTSLMIMVPAILILLVHSTISRMFAKQLP